MTEITAAMVKELRETTGAGMLDCKKALTENAGNMENAIDWLRKKGLASAAKKASRIAAEGLVSVAVEGNKGAVVEVNSETDFVAKNDIFQEFVEDAAQVALMYNGELEAMKGFTCPKVGHTIADVAPEALEREKAIFSEQAAASGKPANIIEKMVEGRIRKYYEEVVLEEQAYIMDPDKKVKEIIADAEKELGAPIKMTGYACFKLGDGLQKKEEDFAAEVAAQLGH